MGDFGRGTAKIALVEKAGRGLSRKLPRTPRMKKHHFVPVLALTALCVAPGLAGAANYEWTFNDGSLTDFFSNGIMAPAGATVTNIVTTDGGAIPHIGGLPAKVLNVPISVGAADGFSLTLGATGPNGTGAYVNQ